MDNTNDKSSAPATQDLEWDDGIDTFSPLAQTIAEVSLDDNMNLSLYAPDATYDIGSDLRMLSDTPYEPEDQFEPPQTLADQPAAWEPSVNSDQQPAAGEPAATQTPAQPTTDPGMRMYEEWMAATDGGRHNPRARIGMARLYRRVPDMSYLKIATAEMDIRRTRVSSLRDMCLGHMIVHPSVSHSAPLDILEAIVARREKPWSRYHVAIYPPTIDMAANIDRVGSFRADRYYSDMLLRICCTTSIESRVPGCLECISATIATYDGQLHVANIMSHIDTLTMERLIVNDTFSPVTVVIDDPPYVLVKMLSSNPYTDPRLERKWQPRWELSNRNASLSPYT